MTGFIPRLFASNSRVRPTAPWHWTILGHYSSLQSHALLTSLFYMHMRFEIRQFHFFKVNFFFFSLCLAPLSLHIYFYPSISSRILNQAIHFSHLVHILSYFSSCVYHHIQIINVKSHYKNMVPVFFT